MESKMKEIINNLECGIKKHSSINRTFRKELITFLNKNQENVQVVAHKFKFNLNFFRLFTEKLEKNKDGLVINELEYYKNFNRLKKFNLIHQKSASSFAKNLTLKSINPNHTSLLIDSYQELDTFSEVRQVVIDYILRTDELSLYYLYIYLRIFALQPLPIGYLQQLKSQNIFSLTNKLTLHYIELNTTVVGNKHERYNLYIYDNIISKFVSDLSINDYQLIFKNVDKYEAFFINFKKDHFPKLRLQALKYLNRNYYIFHSSPLYTTTYQKLIPTVQLTISELDKLFPNTIAQHILEKELHYIDTIFSKKIIEEDEEDVINTKKFSEDAIPGLAISELDELMIFMRDKSNVLNKKVVNNIFREINLYLKIDSSRHTKMFLQYLQYLLQLHLNNKLRASTVRGYIWTLNKHLLKNIVNLNNIQIYELNNLHNKLNSGRYKFSTAKRIIKILNRFFKFHAKHGIKFNTLAFSYPKSIIFEDELELIIKTIENQAKNNVQRLGKHDKLMMLQKQVMILFAFYAGMRKNELRTRLLTDLYIYGNKIYIDINSKGLKKQKMKLKTLNAKRRIGFEVNETHISIIQEWYDLRKNLSKKSNYLFLKRSSTSIFLNEPIEENIFDEFNKIIKAITNRYCTFHSLRHSYSTYSFKNLLQNIKEPYSLLEHAMEMGHETPEIALKSYVHADLLRVMQAL